MHGCFWHRHSGCKYAYTPKSRIEFWMKKFENNQRRDQEVKKELSSEQIKQLIIWECTIKQMNKDREKERAVMERTELFWNRKSCIWSCDKRGKTVEKWLPFQLL